MRKNTINLLFIILFVWTLFLSFIVFSDLNNEKESSIEEVKVSGFSTDFTKVVDTCKSSMVAIEQNNNVSSGFIYKKKNNLLYIATTFHGISENENINVIFKSGAKVNGKLYAYDEYVDVALIECYFPYVVEEMKFGNSTLLKDGEFLLSIGTNNSLDYSFSSKLAMVSLHYQEISNHITFDNKTYEYYLGLIALSGDFTKGFSGAPVINMNGELVGIILMKDSDITFALTGNELNIVLNLLYNLEPYERINLGLKGKYIKDLQNYETNILNINIDLSDGYYVSEVMPFSFASKIGIQKGDVITMINGIKITDSDSLLKLIYTTDNEFVFEIIRNGEKITLQGIFNA